MPNKNSKNWKLGRTRILIIESLNKGKVQILEILGQREFQQLKNQANQNFNNQTLEQTKMPVTTNFRK